MSIRLVPERWRDIREQIESEEGLRKGESGANDADEYFELLPNI